MSYNQPYTTRFDENGVLVNPITKEEPFVTEGQNRAQRRFKEPRFRNNRKFSMVVVNYGKGGFIKAIRRIRQTFDKFGNCTRVYKQYVDRSPKKG